MFPRLLLFKNLRMKKSIFDITKKYISFRQTNTIRSNVLSYNFSKKFASESNVKVIETVEGNKVKNLYIFSHHFMKIL